MPCNKKFDHFEKEKKINVRKILKDINKFSVIKAIKFN